MPLSTPTTKAQKAKGQAVKHSSEELRHQPGFGIIILHTCATNGVIRAPILDIALQVPIAKALFSVGNT